MNTTYLLRLAVFRTALYIRYVYSVYSFSRLQKTKKPNKTHPNNYDWKMQPVEKQTDEKIFASVHTQVMQMICKNVTDVQMCVDNPYYDKSDLR